MGKKSDDKGKGKGRLKADLKGRGAGKSAATDKNSRSDKRRKRKAAEAGGRRARSTALVAGLAAAHETPPLAGKVVWVTGAGSGIGAAVAVRLAALGAAVVLTGRRVAALEVVAEQIEHDGGTAWLQPGDLSNPDTSERVVKAIDARYGRLDILVNNAGVNVLNRSWAELSADGVDTVMGANLSGAFYCSIAVLPIMRRQQGGVLIHTSSWAGRFVSSLSGPAYTASKHAVVAMSHSINLEEFGHGIRSTVINPAEVATEILDKRPVPVPQSERERMLQPEDLASSIAHVALAPPHVCINEILISPTWNRLLAKQLKLKPANGKRSQSGKKKK